MIRSGDYILVTDAEHKRYLQIGEVIDIEYSYDYGYDFESCKVQFADSIDEYDWHFEDCYKVLMFERN
jgi:hypothetical protein